MSKEKSDLEKKVEQATKGSSKEKETPFKDKVKGTEGFMEAIKEHLKAYAKQDPLFVAKLKNKDKNFRDCITYIFNQVKASGQIGYADDEIYKLARHYYDEEKIEVGSPVTAGEVIVNRQISLTEEEIAEAKAKAREKVVAEEMAKMRKKPEKKPVSPSDVKKTQDIEEGKIADQASLF